MAISLIRDRVQVEILRDTSAVSRLGFGVPLFIGTTDEGVRAASYADMDEVEAVYASSSPEYEAAQAFFQQQPRPRELVIGFKDELESYSDAISEIRDINDEWFAVAIESRDSQEYQDVANTVSALPGLRQAWFVSDEAAILDPNDDTDIASVLQNANLDQARVIYHSLGAEAYPDMAMLGRVLPIPESRTTGPGSATWHDQPIDGIPGDSFTTTERNTLEEKNAEFFIAAAGNTRAMGGKMAGGEWGDVMHGVAWLETRLAEDVYQLMTRAADRRSKVPYTDEGIARVEGVVRDRLDRAVSIGLLADPYELSTPLRENTDFGDRANRILRDVSFEAPLAGAIKFVNIQGVVVA